MAPHLLENTRNRVGNGRPDELEKVQNRLGNRRPALGTIRPGRVVQANFLASRRRAARDDWPTGRRPGKRQNPRKPELAGRPDPFRGVSRPEKSVQRLEKVQNRLGNRRPALRTIRPGHVVQAQPFLRAAEGPLAMTGPRAAALASGKIHVSPNSPGGRTHSTESRARKSPCNALKRFKTGSEIGDPRSGRFDPGMWFRPSLSCEPPKGALGRPPWQAAKST